MFTDAEEDIVHQWGIHYCNQDVSMFDELPEEGKFKGDAVYVLERVCLYCTRCGYFAAVKNGHFVIQYPPEEIGERVIR
jgi:hypothetical protein